MVTAGDVLASYRMLSPLGVGGMGEVWLAEHVLLGRRVAIKVLRPEVSERADIVQRFFEEGRAAAQIADPGIVQIYDYGRQGDVAFLVMELLVGESLARRLSRGPFAPAHAAHVASQIAMTMAIAHERGIVHRDLKPDNIFLARDAAAIGGVRVKVLDFGIAKVLAEHARSTRTQTGAILGTPMYMSPEQCRDAAGVDPRSDVYALGCILFEMVCGRPPFIGFTPVELITAHLFESPPESSTLGELASTVARCLAKSPSDRFQSMSEVTRMLAPLASAERERQEPAPAEPACCDGIAYLTTLGTSAGEARVRAPRRSGVRGAVTVVTVLATLALAAFGTTRPASVTADSRVVPPRAASPPAKLDASVRPPVPAPPPATLTAPAPTLAPQRRGRPTRRPPPPSPPSPSAQPPAVVAVDPPEDLYEDRGE
jgi:eukaryotic-like serine/threonine-protein kinase